MNTDRRLENLLCDSELILFENAPTENFTIKAPSKLRRLAREKVERAQLTPSRPIGNLLLNINFHDLEKSLESTKQAMKMEPIAIEVDLTHLSSYPVIHSLSSEQIPPEDKTGKKLSLLEAKMNVYLKYMQQKHQEEIELESAQNIKCARRTILTGNLRNWDSRGDRLVEATNATKDGFVFDPTMMNSYLPFVTKKMEKKSESNFYPYISLIYNFVQKVKLYEPSRPKGQVVNNNILDELDHPSGFLNLTARNIQRNGNINYMLNQSRDSISVRGGSLHDDQYSMRSKIGHSILPRHEKANAILGLLHEFALLTQDSNESSIYLIIKELLKGLKYGPKDTHLTQKELSVEHTNELLQKSCEILQIEFYENCKRVARRRKVEMPNLNASQIDILQIILGYVEEYVLNQEFMRKHQFVRNENNLPIWAILYYLLRAGMTKVFEAVCEEYRGNNMDEVKQALTIYRERVQGIQERSSREAQSKLESEIDSFGYSPPNDVFKNTLVSLLGGNDELASRELLSEVKNYLWFHLFKSQESYSLNPSHKLLDLQRKVKDTERDFMQGNQVLEIVKIQILTLMFSEAVQTLHQSQSYFTEAAQLAFIFEEARLINLQALYRHRGFSIEEHSKIEEILGEFADEIANKFPLEAIAYLCAIDNPKKKAYAIKNLFEKNGLITTFFNTNNASYQMLDKFKSLITPDIYDLFLNFLIETSEVDLNRLTIAYVRILEEAKNSTAIIKMLIEIYYWDVQRLKNSDQKSKELDRDEQITEAKRYLTRLFSDPSHKVFFERNALFKEAILAKQICELIQFYAKENNARKAVDRIEQFHLFDFEYGLFSNKLKILYFQLVEQVLTIYNVYQSQQNVRSISYDSIINQLKPRLERISNYFYESMKGDYPTPERPFSNFNKIESNIKDLLNTLKTIQIINR